MVVTQQRSTRSEVVFFSLAPLAHMCFSVSAVVGAVPRVPPAVVVVDAVVVPRTPVHHQRVWCSGPIDLLLLLSCRCSRVSHQQLLLLLLLLSLPLSSFFSSLTRTMILRAVHWSDRIQLSFSSRLSLSVFVFASPWHRMIASYLSLSLSLSVYDHTVGFVFRSPSHMILKNLRER